MRFLTCGRTLALKTRRSKKSKPLICKRSKSCLEMKLSLEYIIIAPWRALQEVKGEKFFKTILSRVKLGELSLDEMCEEFQN